MARLEPDTSKTERKSEAPYIELLGVAYSVPLQNTAFEKFLDSAHDFFAVNLDTGELDPAVLGDRAAQTELDAHTDRLTQIFDIALASERRQSAEDDTHHAVFQIDRRTLMVSGNLPGQTLVGDNAPVHIDDLPFDYATQRVIRQATADADFRDRIFVATVGEDQTRTYLGLIQRSADEAAAIRVSFSYVSWSDSLLQRLGDAFGLTGSETEVLAGYLQSLTTKEIADARSRSPETIKAQTKSILRKAGCTRMSDVIQLAAGIAYMLRQMPEAGPTDILTSWETPRDHLHVLQRGGRSVAYYKHGTGKRVVVFCHALIQGPFFADAFLEALDRADITLIAPSRPGYGHTTKPVNERDFERDSLEDALAVLNHHSDGPVHVVAQQLGTSHATRLVNALGDRAKSLVLINGGIPLTKDHYVGMDRRVRFAAMSARHAPSVLRLANALGVRAFRKKGVQSFLFDRYQSSAIDMAALNQPGVLELHALGLFHACEQGGIPFLMDEISKHSDWSADLNAVSCPQYWLQPADCNIVNADHVRSVTSNLPRAAFTLEPDCGSIMLYERPERVAEFIVSSMGMALSNGKAESKK